jgi:hypothetical protein
LPVPPSVFPQNVEHQRTLRDITRHLVNQLIKTFVAASIVLALAISADRADAGSLGDFFKALGNSIAHPGQPKKQPTPKPTTRRSKGKTSEQPAADYPPTPAPSPTPTPTASATQTPVRPASAPPTKNSKRDIPYAIPIPDKPGFVTSPYAPKAGYVDVRGFPSGTEVKDPYSGKIFLTP